MPKQLMWNKYINAEMRRGVVFGSRQEMKIFSTVFRDFGKNMVGKTVFSTLGGVANYWRKQQKIEFEIIKNGISIFGHLLKKIFFASNTSQVFGTL